MDITTVIGSLKNFFLKKKPEKELEKPQEKDLRYSIKSTFNFSIPHNYTCEYIEEQKKDNKIYKEENIIVRGYNYKFSDYENKEWFVCNRYLKIKCDYDHQTKITFIINPTVNNIEGFEKITIRSNVVFFKIENSPKNKKIDINAIINTVIFDDVSYIDKQKIEFYKDMITDDEKFQEYIKDSDQEQKDYIKKRIDFNIIVQLYMNKCYLGEIRNDKELLSQIINLKNKYKDFRYIEAPFDSCIESDRDYTMAWFNAKFFINDLKAEGFKFNDETQSIQNEDNGIKKEFGEFKFEEKKGEETYNSCCNVPSVI